MLTFVWACCIATFILFMIATPCVERKHPGASWFDLMPYMRPSKKASGRIQQKRKPRQRRT